MTWFLLLCTQLTPFMTIWPEFSIVYHIDSFQDHITWFFYCVPNWLLSRPFDLILSLCTLLTPFKTIWPNFIIVYPIDSFQDPMTWFLHWVFNLLLPTPVDLILSLYTQLTPFKTIWLILVLCTQRTAFKTIWPDFHIVYPIYSFQHHLTWFWYCVCQLTPFKTIWSDFIIVCPLDSFQDHIPWFLYCLSNWLLSRPFYLILSLCTQLTPFKTLWPDFCTGYLIYSFQHQLQCIWCSWISAARVLINFTPDILSASQSGAQTKFKQKISRNGILYNWQLIHHLKACSKPFLWVTGKFVSNGMFTFNLVQNWTGNRNFRSWADMKCFVGWYEGNRGPKFKWSEMSGNPS